MNNYKFNEEKIFNSGHAACPGCPQALSIRYILNILGSETIGVIPPGCASVISGLQPYSSMAIPIYQTTLESSAAAATGIKRSLQAMGNNDVNVIAIAGDGGTYDIGFQALSGAAERNEDIIYFCIDNEGYMNTGAQKSSATPQYAYTSSTLLGKPTRKKNLVEIMADHQVPYIATATVGYMEDLINKIEKVKAMKGFRMLIILAPCIDGWGLTDDAAIEISRLAVDTGVFPLYEVDGGVKYSLNYGTKGTPVADYLLKQKRFKHLSREQINQMQLEVDGQWEELQKKF